MQEWLLSSPTGFASLLGGCSTTSNRCRGLQARAGSEPGTVKGLQTEPDPAEQTKALRVALLPHHTFSQAEKGLDSFISQTVSNSNHLIMGTFAIYCRPLFLLISVMIITCQMLQDKRSCPAQGLIGSYPYLCPSFVPGRVFYLSFHNSLFRTSLAGWGAIVYALLTGSLLSTVSTVFLRQFRATFVLQTTWSN